MSQAFKCDLTGELGEGSGIRQVDVEIKDGRMLRVMLFTKQGPGKFVHGAIGPKAVDQITKAVQKAFGKPEAEGGGA